METKEKLENRIKYKNRVVWLVGLLWTILSGVFFYLYYFIINPLGLYIILSLMTFTIYVCVGLALKTPKLLLRNIVVYPFGVVVAQILNEISSKWSYTKERTALDFGGSNWLLLLVFYVIASVLAFLLLRLTIGYETTTQNPISSYSYYVEPTEKDAVKLLADYLRLFKDVSPKTYKIKELTCMQFEIAPNYYVIVFAPKKKGEKKEFEVNLLTNQMRSDVICEAKKEEADIIVSVINGFFTTWKKQGYINEWRTEDTPKYAEKLREIVWKRYITTAKIPFKIPSTRQIKYNAVDWIKRNRKQIISVIVTAIIAPIIIHIMTRLLFPS